MVKTRIEIQMVWALPLALILAVSVWLAVRGLKMRELQAAFTAAVRHR